MTPTHKPGVGRKPAQTAVLTVSTEPTTPLSQQDTIEGLLESARRDAVPIRTEFVQVGHGKHTRPGPLAQLISSQDHRGLLAYLLVRAVASSKGDRGWDCTFDADVWIRALELRATTSEAAARSAVSKTFGRLVDRHLLARERVGRTSSLIMLREDGSGEAYTHPGAESDRYFKLPHSFWTSGDYRTLTSPGVAALLIALSLQDGFILPFDQAKPWYGISKESMQTGFRELDDLGVLTHETRWRVNARAPGGYQSQRHYTLLDRYGSNERASKTVRATTAGIRRLRSARTARSA